MEERVTLTIDGAEVQVPKGTTVFQAARNLGIEIPHLCYLEGLAPGGACRLCLVELDGRRLVPACTQRVREGMEVKTNSPRVLEARRFVLELIWSVHPGDCTTCEASGTCALQRYTYELGIEKPLPVELPQEPEVDRESPFIERDLRLCILCGRCVHACRELSQGILDYMRRGMLTLISTPLGKTLDEVGCDFCGNCIAVCPVGCLVEKDRKFRGREWELSPIRSTCVLCGAGCELVLDMGRGEVVRARPGKDGYLCARGKFGWDFSASQERLRTPLIREGKGFREASWEEALGLIAEKLGEIRKREGPQAVGGLAGAHLPTEALYAFGRFVRGTLGAGNLDLFPGHITPEEAMVLFRMGTTVEELEEAEVILAVGPALGESYPRVRVAIKRALKRGAKLIVVDPLSSELARLAQVHLRPRPGKEATVLAALARELHQQGPAAGKPPDELWEHLDELDLEGLDEAVRLLSSGKGMVVLGAAAPGLLSWAGALLSLSGRPRGLVLASPWANLWGALAAGIHPELLPGPRPLDKSGGEWLSQIWGRLVPEGGLDGPRMLSSDSPLKALYLLGADPVAMAPGPQGLKERLSELELLVVQDLFLTPTAQLAHVVLPLRSFVEEQGTLLLPGGKRRRLATAVRTDLPPTWRVFRDLSERLGFPWEVRSVRDVERELVGLLGAPGDVPLPPVPPTEPEEKGLLTVTYFPRFALPESAWSKRSRLAELTPTCDSVGLSPDDAEALGLREGQEVKISSSHGEARGRVWRWDALPPGTVAVPFALSAKLGPGAFGPPLQVAVEPAQEVN